MASERKQRLKAALDWEDPTRFTPHRRGEGEAFLAEACDKGWEGLIAKRADSPYRSARSKDWRKLECVNEQELVIGGYTDPQGSRKVFGALLVGYYEGDEPAPAPALPRAARRQGPRGGRARAAGLGSTVGRLSERARELAAGSWVRTSRAS